MPCFRSPSFGPQTGVPVLADGAQSVGAVPATAAGVDFLTISGQKWLCGPDATGALVVSDPERLALHLAELLLPARVRPGRLVRAAAGRPALRGRLVVARHVAGDARRARASTRVVARARRGHGRAVPGAPARPGRARRAGRGLDARRLPAGWRPGAHSSRACTRRASTSATSRAAASSASRAAGGRATRISTGSSPRWAEEHRCPT